MYKIHIGVKIHFLLVFWQEFRRVNVEWSQNFSLPFCLSVFLVKTRAIDWGNTTTKAPLALQKEMDLILKSTLSFGELLRGRFFRRKKSFNWCYLRNHLSSLFHFSENDTKAERSRWFGHSHCMTCWQRPCGPAGGGGWVALHQHLSSHKCLLTVGYSLLLI